MSQFHPLQISRVEPETDTAICVEFAVPDKLKDTFRFLPGQYLTLQAPIDGADLRRSYSICSGPSEPALRVAIKRIEGGAFSTWAHQHLRPGTHIDVMAPQGRFVVNTDAMVERQYMCIAAGSGITPMMSIVRAVLEDEPESRVTLIYGNQRTSTIMFREELGFLKNRYLNRFNWINVLSREEQDAEVLFGRINNRKGGELQAKHLIDIDGTDAFYLCGPEAMISEVSRGLRVAGVTEDRIHYELFFANPLDAEEVVRKHHERATKYANTRCEVAVTLDGRTHRFDLNADGENILDAAMNSGMDVPYSCKGGVCATCKAKLVEGEVDMDLNHSLTAQEVADGYILTCQAHPVSERVVVDFDQI